MPKRLIVTEKPSVARDIADALGAFSEEDGFWESDEYVLTFAVGHLLELLEPEDLDPMYKRWTLDTLPILPAAFPLKPKSGTQERLRTIKGLLKRPDVLSLVNACDAGREGELIFREIFEYLESDKPIERLWLQSMTKTAIRKGFEALQDGKKYEGLSSAAHCRNYSDWLIGMNATRALTRRLKSRSENQAWSAGRVQTPTLAMLVDRETAILRHRAEPFWRVVAEFVHDGQAYKGTWFDPDFQASEDSSNKKDDRIFKEERAQDIVARTNQKSGRASETRKPSRESAPPLFDLTGLQREGNRRFGWSARRTLNAAQRCYERHKVLTYPRTDSRALPKDYRSVVDEVFDLLAVDSRFEAACTRLKRDGLQNEARTFDDNKVSDHFAIVPTGVISDEISGDDAKLYELVTRRFLATFHSPAVWSKVERVTVVEGESFRSRAKTLEEPGWREVMGEAADEAARLLPPLIVGRDEARDVPVDGGPVEQEQDETKPPPRITEARLLSLMENAGKDVEDENAAEAMKDRGIGTPATRADTIENLISKGYALRAGRGLRPSVKGIRLIDILRRMNAERLASAALTGELEHDLAQVEHGEMNADAFMAEVYDYTKEVVQLAKEFEFEDLYPNDEVLGSCPLCTKPVYERSWFYRCLEPEGLPKRRPKKTKKQEASDEPEIVDCPFRIWKDKSGRYVDRQTVVELLTDGTTRPLDGFATRQGRTFRGILELVDGLVELKRVSGGEEDGDSVFATPEYEVDETPLGRCPQCQEADVVETRSTFVCHRGLTLLKELEKDETSVFPLKKKEIPEGAVYCPFVMPRTVCRRELTRPEILHYMKEGRTEILSDFISRRGRPFSAMLILKDTGRHGFEFPPRGGAKDSETADTATKKKATKKKATKKKATKKKATKKKATKKKATKKKATKKKATKKKATKKKATKKKATEKKVSKVEEAAPVA